MLARLATPVALWCFAVLVALFTSYGVYNIRNSSDCCAGLMAADKGRFDEAERFFQIVLQQDSNSASAWSNLGNVHLSQGRAEDAVRDFSRAVALAPQVWRLHAHTLVLAFICKSLLSMSAYNCL